jgi:two-component system, OmpR family, phosphate regulon response regulator PhoB
MRRQRILIIDETGRRARALANQLDRDGHETVVARDREDGVRQAQTLSPDLIILDMPVADSVEQCWQFGESDDGRLHDVPVYVTAEDCVAVTAVSCAGEPTPHPAPDALCNLSMEDPFMMRHSPQADLTSPPVKPTHVLEYRGVRIDLLQHQAYSSGAKLQLTPTEFRLLECFLRQPGRAFSRTQLMESAITKGNIVLERTIDGHVKSLRRKLNSNRVVIETVRGIGYRFRDPRE